MGGTQNSLDEGEGGKGQAWIGWSPLPGNPDRLIRLG